MLVIDVIKPPGTYFNNNIDCRISLFLFPASTALNSVLSQMSTNLTNKQKKQGCPSFSVADCGGEVKKLSLSSSRFQSSSGFVLFKQDTDPIFLATKWFDSKLPTIRG